MCPLAEVRGVLGNDRGLGRETRRSPLPSERRRAGAARAERRVRSMRRAAGAAGLRGGRAGRTVVKVPQQPRRVPPPGQGVLHELALGAPLRQVNYIIFGGFRGLRHGRQPGRNLAPQRWRNCLIILLGEEVKVAPLAGAARNPRGGGAEGPACRSRCAILGPCRSSASFFARWLVSSGH